MIGFILVLLYIIGIIGSVLYYAGYREVYPNITRMFITMCPIINLIPTIIVLKRDKISLKNLFGL